MLIHPDTVRSAVARSAISKAELARAAGMHPNSLSGLEREDWNPRWQTLSDLCKAVESIKMARA